MIGGGNIFMLYNNVLRRQNLDVLHTALHSIGGWAKHCVEHCVSTIVENTAFGEPLGSPQKYGKPFFTVS
jgi:hypothetical protein